MALYDQQVPQSSAPWYAGSSSVTTNPYQPVNNQVRPQVQPVPQNGISQFVWVNGPGTVEMWPVAPRSEMTFIDNEAMILYVKRVDEYNHPLKTRKFKLTEILDEEVSESVQPQPQISMEELKAYLSEEVNKAVSNRMNNLFNPPKKEGGE